MKKIIMCLLIISILISGCSSSEFDALTYDTSYQKLGDTTSSISNNNLFASNLSVMTEEDSKKASDPAMTSSASLIINRTKNEVIYGSNVFDKLYPASITKIVTALVALKHGNLDDIIEISYSASHISEAGAKLCGFNEGDQISFRALLNSLLVYSGNDAGIAIAEYMAGSEEAFAKMMNDEIKLLGATHSNYINSHGLHENNHYTTAYDIYLVFNELLNYKEFTSIINQSSFKAEYINKSGQEIAKIFPNSNQYLAGEYKAPTDIKVLGGKTGTTNAAGYCLVILSEDDNGDEYISIVLNASSKADLYNQMNHLLSMVHK